MSDTPFKAYITNLGKYAEGKMAGEWLDFPTTKEDLQAVLKEIGVDGIRYEEYFFTAYESEIDGLHAHLPEYGSVDELNYLASLINEFDSYELKKFEAAVETGEYTSSAKDLINLTQNLDCYELLEDVSNETELGDYYADTDFDALAPLLKQMEKSHDYGERAVARYIDKIQSYIDTEGYGRDISINDGGSFTNGGYICNNQESFSEVYNGKDIPEEYKVFAYPKREKPRQKTNSAHKKARPAPSHDAR